MAKIHWIMEKGREFQKNIYFCFIDYAKAFDCVEESTKGGTPAGAAAATIYFS